MISLHIYTKHFAYFMPIVYLFIKKKEGREGGKEGMK